MGVWIEIFRKIFLDKFCRVTPLVGVWIEIHNRYSTLFRRPDVTPLVGVWIEILFE